MGTFVKVASTRDIPENGLLKVELEERTIVIVHTDGEYYAVQSRCPHLGGDLAKSALEGTVITCHLHGSQFDVRDGSVVRWLKGDGLMKTVSGLIKKEHGLETYPVRIDENDIWVDM